MWQDKLKEIIYILENSDVNEIEVTFWGKKFRVLKNSPNITTSSPNKAINTKNSQSSSSDNLENQNLDEENKISILSPMPGVFYSSQSPDKPTYVKEGDTIKSGQVLCIIESMKIMNEIESEMSGIVTEILVNNADPVEYNQTLFVINQT